MGQIVSDVSDILKYQDDKNATKSARREILAQMAADNTEKQNLVRRVLATQRAKYGAAGMSGHGVTEQTVLERLRTESEAPYNAKRAANLNKLKKATTTKKNLLTSLLEHFDKIVK